MKKLFTLLLSLTTLSFGLLFVTSCSTPKPEPPHTHSLQYVEELSPNCVDSGTSAHYVCECGKKFADQNATQEITSTTLAVDENNHKQLTFVNGSVATCVQRSMLAHYKCTACNNLYEDENATVSLSIDDIYYGELGSHVNYELVPATLPKCNGEQGYIEHYKCNDCNIKSLTSNFDNEVLDYELIDYSSPATHVNVTKTEEVKATCNSYGTKEHYTCTSCLQMYLDEELTITTYVGDYLLTIEYDYFNHPSLNFFNGIDATCMSSGIKDYYECLYCYRKFEDQNGTKEIYGEADLYLPQTSHSGNWVPEQFPTCQNGYIGNWQHFHCEVCNQNYDSEYGSYPMGDVTYVGGDIYDYNSHVLTFVEAKKQTCIQDGNLAYSYCACGAYFDEFNFYYDGRDYFYMGFEKNEYSHSLIYLPQKEASCENGNIECYKCEFCNNYYDLSVDFYMPTPDYIIPENQAIIPSTGRHNLVAYPYQAPTCTEYGMSAHWKCSSCLKTFGDSAGINLLDENLIPLVPSGHRFTHIDYKASTCLIQGNIAYSHCSKCNKDFNLLPSPIEDVTGNTLLPLSEHQTTLVEGMPATCTENGVKDSYYCSVCEKSFEEDRVTEITDFVIVAPGHSYKDEWERDENEHWHETTCGHDVISTPVAHNQKGYRVTQKSTCYINGFAEIYCSDCQYVIEETVLALEPHDYVYVATVLANCKTPGVSEHYICKTCTNWFDLEYRAKVKSYFDIPTSTAEHQYESVTTKGTCKTEGTLTKTCSVCGDVQTSSLGLGTCSYKLISIDEYYHSERCEYCGTDKTSPQLHNINNATATCTICKTQFDFTTNLTYYTGFPSGDSNTEYAFITGVSSSTPSSKTLKIPSMIGQYKVYEIYLAAFQQTSYETVVIPDEVQYIDNYAFNNCTSLKSILFTSNSKLKGIGTKAFYNTVSLKNFTMPQSVTRVHENAFEQSAIELVEFYSLQYLDELAFYNCESLQRVHFYDSCTIETISNRAFEHCTNLKAIRLPTSLKNINDRAFYMCSSIEGIDFPETIVKIGSYAFYKAFDANLEISITIPESIKQVSSYAFAYSNISEVYLLGFSSYEDYVLGPTNYGEYAFNLCKLLDKVVIGENVEVIADLMFYGTESLADLTFENSKNIKYIGAKAFYYSELPSLSFTVGENVEFIGGMAFTRKVDGVNVNFATLTFENYENLMLINATNPQVIMTITDEASLQSAIAQLIEKDNYAIVPSDYFAEQFLK